MWVGVAYHSLSLLNDRGEYVIQLGQSQYFIAVVIVISLSSEQMIQTRIF